MLTQEKNQSLTKNQFVYFVTTTVKELPFGIWLGKGCIPEHFVATEDRRFKLNETNEDATLGEVWEFLAQGTGRQAYFSLHLPIEKDLAPVDDGSTLLDVCIVVTLTQRHLFDQELLLKDIISAAGWMAMHEIQELAARKMKCEKLIPHGTNKQHVSPKWKRFRQS